MKIDKTQFPNSEKQENGLADKSELSAKIERVVSSLLQVFIQYLKTIFLIFFRPFKSSLMLSVEIEKDTNTTSNPITFLVISTFICSLFISLSYRIFIEADFDYDEIAYLVQFELAKTIKDSTSLTNVLLTSFPGIIASVLSVLIIRLYLNAKDKQVIRCNGVWYIAIAFSGMLISISGFVLVFFMPAIVGIVIGSAVSGAFGGRGSSTSRNLVLAFFEYLPLLSILGALFYSTVLVARSYEYINKTYFIKTLYIKSFRFFMPTFRLLFLPAVLIVSLVIYLGGMSLPTAISHLMAPKERKDLVVSVFKETSNSTEMHVKALVKNASRHDIVFLTDSIFLRFESDEFLIGREQLGELVSIYGGKDNPVKILKSGETQWLILKSKIPEDICNTHYDFGKGVSSVYFRVVIKNVYKTDKLFRNNDEFLSTLGSGEEKQSEKRYLCSHKKPG